MARVAIIIDPDEQIRPALSLACEVVLEATPVPFRVGQSDSVALGIDTTLSTWRITVLTGGHAPTGADLILNVTADGVTLFTDQSTRPKLPAGQTSATGDVPGSPLLSAGTVLAVTVAQVGSSTPGDYTQLTLVGRYTG